MHLVAQLQPVGQFVHPWRYLTIPGTLSPLGVSAAGLYRRSAHLGLFVTGLSAVEELRDGAAAEE